MQWEAVGLPGISLGRTLSRLGRPGGPTALDLAIRDASVSAPAPSCTPEFPDSRGARPSASRVAWTARILLKRAQRPVILLRPHSAGMLAFPARPGIPAALCTIWRAPEHRVTSYRPSLPPPTGAILCAGPPSVPPSELASLRLPPAPRSAAESMRRSPLPV